MGDFMPTGMNFAVVTTVDLTEPIWYDGKKEADKVARMLNRDSEYRHYVLTAAAYHKATGN
jgi:hypothetical protein